jgi:hypothetical protein
MIILLICIDLHAASRVLSGGVETLFGTHYFPPTPPEDLERDHKLLPVQIKVALVCLESVWAPCGIASFKFSAGAQSLTFSVIRSC